MERVHIRFPQILIIDPHCGHPPLGHQSAHRQIAHVHAGKQLTGGAEHALPLRQAVADGVDPHGGGHLGCIILRIGLIPRVGRAHGSALVKRHLAVHPAPALGQHSVGGKLRAGAQG